MCIWKLTISYHHLFESGNTLQAKSTFSLSHGGQKMIVAPQFSHVAKMLPIKILCSAFRQLDDVTKKFYLL